MVVLIIMLSLLICFISYFFCFQVTYQRLIAAYCQNGDIEGAR